MTIARGRPSVIKNKIELIKDLKPQVLLTWRKLGDDGERIPIAIEYSDEVDAEMRQRIEEICQRPMNVAGNGVTKKVFSGSSAHFLALPKALARLGFRTRMF